MSRIKLKQLNNTNASTGGTIVFNGTNLVYSNNDSGAIQLPSGTNAQRPSGNNGFLRYNTDEDCIEGYISGSWTCLANTSQITQNFQRVEVTTSSYTVQTNDTYIGVNSGVETTITLESSPSEGKQIIVKDENGTASINNINIDGNGNNIDNKTDVTIGVDYGSLTFIFAGTEWHIV